MRRREYRCLVRRPNGKYACDMETDTTPARVEVDRRSLADLIDLAQRAAHELRSLDPVLADSINGAVTQVQVETYLAG